MSTQIPIWMSFQRSTVNGLLELALHVQQKGVQIYRFNGGIAINPINADGQYLDTKIMTVFDYVPTVGALFEKLEMEPDERQLKSMAAQFGDKDWRSITVTDCLIAYERQIRG